MKSSELFVKCLENEGVEYIFGMAGEENLHLLEALRKSKIKYIPVRHEQAAGFMAATIGRLTGKPGVCLSTLGPGATNFVTCAAYAKLAAMPMVMITGQKPIRNNPQGNFQIIDVLNILKPLTYFSASISFCNKIPTTIREAFRIAEQERPGAVHIELPKDVANDDIENIKPLKFDAKVRRPIAEYKAIDKAIEMISNAKSPLILIGAGANRKTTRKTLTQLINKFHIPFVDTQMGKGVVDERNEMFIGTTALTANDYVHKAILKSDLIINVGHDIVEKSPFLMNENSNFKVIHINFFGANVNEYYFPELEVIGDIANSIWQISEKLEISNKWDFTYTLNIKKEIEKNIYNKKIEKTYPFKPQHIVKEVREAVNEDGIITLDNGMYKLWFARYYKTYNQNTILLDNALATMGAGLPSGIATKLLNPSKQVLVVTGDGGFMMNSQELETAVRLKLDLVILLINDSGLGMIKWEQNEKNYKNFGLDHGNPDFIKYAQSFGAKGLKINKEDNISEVIKNAFKEGGVQLIDISVDYSENIKVFTKEIHNIKF